MRETCIRTLMVSTGYMERICVVRAMAPHARFCGRLRAGGGGRDELEEVDMMCLR